MTENDVENELLDYEEDEVDGGVAGDTGLGHSDSVISIRKEGVKGSYVSIHSSGFRDFLLKPELLRAIVDCGFEHPSEGEQFCMRSYKFLGYQFKFSMNIFVFFLFQFNMNAFLRRSWGWTYYVRPSLEWGRRLSLCWPLFSSWSQ